MVRSTPSTWAPRRDALARALREFVEQSGIWTTVATGGSMEPTVPRGSVVAVEPLPRRLALGDLLAFVDAERPAVCCHRVVALRTDGYALTRGDRMGDIDPRVDPTRFVGIVRRYRVGGCWFLVDGAAPGRYRRLRHRIVRRFKRHLLDRTALER